MSTLDVTDALADADPDADLTERLRRFLGQVRLRVAAQHPALGVGDHDAVVEVETGHHDAHVDVTRIASALAAGAALVEPGDILGPGGAAEVLGKDRTTVSRWIRSGYMPPPFQEVSGVPVWTRSAIAAFKLRHDHASDASGRRPLGSG